MIRLKEEKRIVILEVVCAWDRLVSKREAEKRGKYDALKADQAKVHEGYMVMVVPVVFGDPRD